MIIRKFHRRNLPHLYYNDGTYFITYRLAETIPLPVLKQLQKELSELTNEELNIKQKRIFKKYDDYLDKSSHDPDYLNKNEIADVIKNTLHYPDGKEYFLICYCIMPNHVHLVFSLLKTNKGISKIMQSVKRVSALNCNKLLNQKGKFWQEESFDRLVRDDIELYNIINYVINNPVKAGLVDDWTKWKNTYLAKDYQ